MVAEEQDSGIYGQETNIHLNECHSLHGEIMYKNIYEL